jgi:hypothetical protein
MSVYVLVATIKKRHQVAADLYTILQILSLTLFERIPLNQIVTDASDQDYRNHGVGIGMQLNLFDNFPGRW